MPGPSARAGPEEPQEESRSVMQLPKNQHPHTRWASKTVLLPPHTTLTSQKPAENLSTTQGLKSATMGSRGGSWEPLDCFDCLRGLLLLGFLLMARAIGGLQGCNSGGGWGAALGLYCSAQQALAG